MHCVDCRLGGGNLFLCVCAPVWISGASARAETRARGVCGGHAGLRAGVAGRVFVPFVCSTYMWRRAGALSLISLLGERGGERISFGPSHKPRPTTRNPRNPRQSSGDDSESVRSHSRVIRPASAFTAATVFGKPSAAPIRQPVA